VCCKKIFSQYNNTTKGLKKITGSNPNSQDSPVAAAGVGQAELTARAGLEL